MKKSKRKSTHLFLLLLIMILSSCAVSKKLPQGEVNILDQIYSDQEWKNGKTIPLKDSLSISALNDEENVYIGIDYKDHNKKEYRWVEMFIEIEGKMHRLHASGQLGEQIYDGTDWTEEWNWGNNNQWLATKHGMNTEKNRGYEFSLNKKRFGAKEIKLMLSIFKVKKTSDFSQQPEVIHFPAEGNNKNTKTWFSLTY